MNRSKDWLNQAERDLAYAKVGLQSGFYEWACFIAQQAAEKALKAICEKHKVMIRTHQLTQLIEVISDLEKIPDNIYEGAIILDRFYIPTRYPNGFKSGTPMEYFRQKDAEEAISYAETIIRFCSNKVTE